MIVLSRSSRRNSRDDAICCVEIKLFAVKRGNTRTSVACIALQPRSRRNAKRGNFLTGDPGRDLTLIDRAAPPTSPRGAAATRRRKRRPSAFAGSTDLRKPNSDRQYSYDSARETEIVRFI